jgi:hypothetical protein
MQSDIGSLLVSGLPVTLYQPGDDLPDIGNRIHLSRGTCPAQAIDKNEPCYEDNARVPVPDWRPATAYENSILWSMSAPPAYRGVGIVRLLSPSILRLFENRRDIFENPSDEETLKHPLIDLFLDVIAKKGLVVKYVHSARIGRDEPGRLTMTKAIDRDARVGLHFDRWDRCPMDELENSTNRVAMNLGPTDRYFVFMSQTAAGMCSMLNGRGVQVPHDVSPIGKAFMQTFPSYPVVRVRLQPGEAYVAPTENILHDGSSAEVNNVNHYLSIRGRFDFADRMITEGDLDLHPGNTSIPLDH